MIILELTGLFLIGYLIGKFTRWLWDGIHRW